IVLGGMQAHPGEQRAAADRLAVIGLVVMPEEQQLERRWLHSEPGTVSAQAGDAYLGLIHPSHPRRRRVAVLADHTAGERGRFRVLPARARAARGPHERVGGGLAVEAWGDVEEDLPGLIELAVALERVGQAPSRAVFELAGPGVLEVLAVADRGVLELAEP